MNNNNNNNNNSYIPNADPDSGSESANSQDNNSQRQLVLEMRHQELLKKQKALQEQYQRLQQMSKNAIPLAAGESNMSLSGSQRNLSSGVVENADKVNDNLAQPQTTVTTNKKYETDIL
jgi:predicted transcriptional regulator